MDKFAGQTSGWDQHISMGPGYSCSKKEKTWSHGLIINFIKCSSFHIFYRTSIFLGTSVFPWDQYTSMGPAYFHGTSILLWDQYTSLGPVFYNRTKGTHQTTSLLSSSVTSRRRWSWFRSCTTRSVNSSEDSSELPGAGVTLSRRSEKERVKVSVCADNISVSSSLRGRQRGESRPQSPIQVTPSFSPPPHSSPSQDTPSLAPESSEPFTASTTARNGSR